MRLHTLQPRPGAKHRRKRLGQGESSGLGKTSGKGHKGQKARSGGGLPHAGFEGGQMPLYRKLPRRGFNNAAFHKNYAVINVSTLESFFEAGAEVNEESLRELGLVKGSKWHGVKVLADGEITKSLKVEVDKCSEAAKAKIEKAGGSVTVKEAAKAPVKEKKKASPAKKAVVAEKSDAPVKEPAAEKVPAKKAAKKAAKKEKASSSEVVTGKYEGSAAPLEDNSQPEGFPIKGNEDSMKYHLPEGRYYKQTVAEVWFATEKDAEKAGFVAAGA